MHSTGGPAITAILRAFACGGCLAWCAGCAGPSTSGTPTRPPEPATQGSPISKSDSTDSSGTQQRGHASFYSDRLAGWRTASGERYAPAKLTAAHRTLPFGAVVDVVRDDGRRVQVRINDRGPFTKSRIIDVSRRAAEMLGIVREGTAEVSVLVVSLPPAKKRKR